MIAPECKSSGVFFCLYLLAMDYRNPDYPAIFARRLALLAKLRSNPKLVAPLRVHYAANPIDFIRDWGVTSDPRNIERGLPATIPLIPFARQEESLAWILDLWRGGQSGLIEKSRDMGCSVTIMALFATMALFHKGFVAGVGSRKEDLVDGVGDPKTLFYKARMFLKFLPREFRGGWTDAPRYSSHMKLWIPDTDSVIIGEAGDNIGRGGRSSVYLVDEKAFIRNQFLVDAALSQNTRCQIDLSSVNGPNEFAKKRNSGRVQVFTFHWRQDPRKDEAWYEGEKARLDPLIVAQEIDLDYSASQVGVIIPSSWVQAAIGIGAHLGVKPSGATMGALDVADEGKDKNAFAVRKGMRLTYASAWSGKGSDIYHTSAHAMLLCDERGMRHFYYDADGLGAGVRGDVNALNAKRAMVDRIKAEAWRGSGEVVNPDKMAIDPTTSGATGRTNADFFRNRKSQGWWHLRQRFQNTYRARNGLPYDKDMLIDLDPALPELAQLCGELSQPTYGLDTNGKIIVNKAPDGALSPNLADAVMMVYSPIKMGGAVGMLPRG